MTDHSKHCQWLLKAAYTLLSFLTSVTHQSEWHWRSHFKSVHTANYTLKCPLMTIANMSREVEVTAVSALSLACAIKKRKRKRIWMRDFLFKKNQGKIPSLKNLWEYSYKVKDFNFFTDSKGLREYSNKIEDFPIVKTLEICENIPKRSKTLTFL